MKKCVAIFRSRSETRYFIERLRLYNVPCRSIDTPKEAHLGCGTSAEFPPNEIARAKAIIQSGRFKSFYCFLLVEKDGFKTKTTKI